MVSAPSAAARPLLGVVFRWQPLRLLPHPQLLGLLTCAPCEEQSLPLTRVQRLLLLTLVPTEPGSPIPSQEAALLQACAAAGGGQEEAGSQQAQQQPQQQGPARHSVSGAQPAAKSTAACTDGMGPGGDCWQPIMGRVQHTTGRNMRHHGRAPHQPRQGGSSSHNRASAGGRPHMWT
jgi:hypothetical protein